MNAGSVVDAASTRMFSEAGNGSDAVRAQLRQDGAEMAAIGAQLRRLKPRAVVTCARGSSDHAATYAKYLIETHAGVLTASAAPSISSIYGVKLDLRDCLFIAISQSGRSPDLLASVAAARMAGATVLSLCNDPASPLHSTADFPVQLRAGVETSVAATKSYLATLAALARLVAVWTANEELQSAIDGLPDLMDASWQLDWSAAMGVLERARSLYVVGRGVGLSAAQEIALKCKETCALHAEAFSSAELRHGPYTLLAADFPALIVAQADATLGGVEAMASELAQRGVPVLIAGAASYAVREAGAVSLPTVQSAPTIAPLLRVQSAYRLIANLSVRRGLDPDHPPHLCKITETV